MKTQSSIRILSGLFLVTLIVLSTGTVTVHGQFTQNRDTIKIEAATLPPEVHKGYRMFQAKCNECHGLDTSLKPSMSASRWTSEVKRMQAMPSAQFNDKEAKTILDFLNYDELHRKAQLKSTARIAMSDSVSLGHQFYAAQSCDACHSISGSGGTAGPALTDVGRRLTQDRLLELMRQMKAGDPICKMPPLPPDTTDKQINDVVAFLATLKG